MLHWVFGDICSSADVFHFDQIPFPPWPTLQVPTFEVTLLRCEAPHLFMAGDIRYHGTRYLRLLFRLI